MDARRRGLAGAGLVLGTLTLAAIGAAPIGATTPPSTEPPVVTEPPDTEPPTTEPTTTEAPTTTAFLPDGAVTATPSGACDGDQAVFRVTIATTVDLVDVSIGAFVVVFDDEPVPLPPISTGPIPAGGSFTAELDVEGGRNYAANVLVAWAGHPPGDYEFVETTGAPFVEVCDIPAGSPTLNASGRCADGAGAIDLVVTNPAGGDEPSNEQVVVYNGPPDESTLVDLWFPVNSPDGGTAARTLTPLPAGDYPVFFAWDDSAGRPIDRDPVTVTVPTCSGIAPGGSTTPPTLPASR
jgi:hypothetical protein